MRSAMTCNISNRSKLISRRIMLQGCSPSRFSGQAPHIDGMTDPTTLERAFALAESGGYATVEEIRGQLKREYFDQVDAHLAGAAITRQLRALCDKARAACTE